MGVKYLEEENLENFNANFLVNFEPKKINCY
jgi:hypothetical protein